MESFLVRLNGKRVCGDVENMVFLKQNKEWEVLDQIPLLRSRAGQLIFVSLKLHLEHVGAAQD